MTTAVLLTTEGTYPFYRGGVSTWCHQMIGHAAGTDFHVFSVVPSPHEELAFTLPDNVRSIDKFALWGTEKPGCLPISFAEDYERRLRTTDEHIAGRFLAPFSIVVRAAFTGFESDPGALGVAFSDLHRYFEYYDYATTLTSRAAWECFKACSAQTAVLTLDEATTCMRWLVRYLAITSRPFAPRGVVHASMAGLAAVPGVICKLRDGTPFLLSEHGIHLRELYVTLSKMDVSGPCRRFLLGWNQAIVGMNYHYADHVTCLGEFNRKWQIRFGANPEKIEFVPNGVDAQRFFPEPARRPPELTVLTLARIYGLKGIDNLLRAAAIVIKSAPDVRFRILGDVADEGYFAECMRIVREGGLEAAVSFGLTHEPEVEMRAAHVYCLPSVSEGLPYSLLEAMFSGCPVVATDVGNVAETLKGTGLLVAPSDHEALAKALLSLLDGPESGGLRERLASAALSRVRQRYSLDVSMRPFVSRYRKLQQCPDRRLSA